tara:strand:+ start:592 stop:1953 length:1362 start_codon:yes stop_codon:yes gene_type:complete
MPVKQALKDAYEGVSASNAVGTPNAGVLDQHPGEYIFQKYVGIAESCGISIDVEDCFHPQDQPGPFKELEEEQEQKFIDYSRTYSSAIEVLIKTLREEEDEDEFLTSMFQVLHQDKQFCRVCSFLVSKDMDNLPTFETPLHDPGNEWFFDGTELEDKQEQHTDESVEEYLVKGAAYPCKAYSVHLDRYTDEVWSLVDRWNMQSIKRSTFDECNDEITELNDPDERYIVVKESDHGFHHHEGSAQEEGTRDECQDWINNNSGNEYYHSIPRYEIKQEITLIPEEYHPSIILGRMDQIARTIGNLRMIHIKLGLRFWLIYGPSQGNSLMMQMNNNDDEPKSAPNPLTNYPDDDSKQFVCKLRPGKWSNELNKLADAFTKLPPGFELAILLWVHSANSNFTGSIHSQIQDPYKSRIAGIVHYDNQGTYISEHEYTQDGWELVDKNPEHKGPIKGFN